MKPLSKNDIAPKLYEQIKKRFKGAVATDPQIRAVRAKIKSGTVTHSEAWEYSKRLSSLLEDSFKTVLSVDELPDGQLYWNIATRVLNPFIEEAYNSSAEITATIQDILWDTDNIGLKSQASKLKKDRLSAFDNKIVAADSEKVQLMFEGALSNIIQSSVADTIQLNADFAYKAGVSGIVIRRTTGKCCAWCTQMAGTYDYHEIYAQGDDVWRRHDNCDCTIEYRASTFDRSVVSIDAWHGRSGKARNYVPDGYGGFEKSKAARIEHAEEMARTKEQREAAAREKRIATWAKKRANNN